MTIEKRIETVKNDMQLISAATDVLEKLVIVAQRNLELLTLELSREPPPGNVIELNPPKDYPLPK